MHNCITCIYRLRLGDCDDSPTIIVVSAYYHDDDSLNSL